MINKTFKPKPYVLENEIQNYEWGQKGKDAFIPKLVNIEPEKDKPYAELWIGAHPKAPSRINGTGLDELIIEFPVEILGKNVASKFGNKLPYLLKVLSAGEALSIQAHPNKQQAVLLHKKDPQNYPDDNHKPEIAIALDSLTALVGFRKIDEIINVMIKYPEIADFAGNENVEFLKTSKDEKKSLKLFNSAILNRNETDKDALNFCLKNLQKRIEYKSDKTEEEKLFLELREKYSDDIGLFYIFLLNLIHLNPGQAVFLNAGIPHAYLKGNIIECMANSDNVVRVGLTPKFKDIPTLIEMLTYENGMVKILGDTSDKNKTIYTVPIPEFQIAKEKMEVGEVISIKNNRLEIILLIEGEIEINYTGQTMIANRGQTILFPAILNEYTITVKESTIIYKVEIPE